LQSALAIFSLMDDLFITFVCVILAPYRLYQKAEMETF
jgi:hypothetical protein